MKRENFQFQSEAHQKNFNELMAKDAVDAGDSYREVFFYIMSCELCERFVQKIYDFKQRQLIPEGFPEFASSGERQLINIAMYIFTGGRTEMDLNSVMHPLGRENIEMVLSSLRYFYQSDSVPNVEEYLRSKGFVQK